MLQGRMRQTVSHSIHISRYLDHRIRTLIPLLHKLTIGEYNEVTIATLLHQSYAPMTGSHLSSIVGTALDDLKEAIVAMRGDVHTQCRLAQGASAGVYADVRPHVDMVADWSGISRALPMSQ